jgi:hypothetical protein
MIVMTRAELKDHLAFEVEGGMNLLRRSLGSMSLYRRQVRIEKPQQAGARNSKGVPFYCSYYPQELIASQKSVFVNIIVPCTFFSNFILN